MLRIRTRFWLGATALLLASTLGGCVYAPPPPPAYGYADPYYGYPAYYGPAYYGPAYYGPSVFVGGRFRVH